MNTLESSQSRIYAWFVPEYKTFYPYDMNILGDRGVDEFTFTPGSLYAFTTEKKLMKLFNKQRKPNIFMMRKVERVNPMYHDIITRSPRRNLELLKLRSRNDEIEMVVTAGERIILASEECNIAYHRYMPAQFTLHATDDNYDWNKTVHDIFNDKYLDAILTIRSIADYQESLIDEVSLFIGIFGETLRDCDE